MKQTFIAGLLMFAFQCSVAQAQPRPLGTLTVKKQVTPPAGFSTATQFKVQIPNTIYSPGMGLGEVAVAYPSGTPVEADVFMGGHGGGKYFFDAGDLTLTTQLRDSLLANNHIVAEVRWLSSGWFWSPPNYRYGMESLACNPATSFRYIFDNIAAPRGLKMKLIGISAGSAQIGYALSSYGEGQITATAILISGPPFAQIKRGCLQDGVYSYTYSETAMIDISYGFLTQAGPCTTHNPTWSQVWDEDSVDTGGIRYYYPNTRVIMITGNRDSGEILNRAYDFRDELLSAGEPVEHYPIPTMGHSIQQSPEGMNQLQTLLLQP